MHHPGPQGGLVYRIKYCESRLVYSLEAVGVPYLQSVGFVHAAANLAKSALDAPAVGARKKVHAWRTDWAASENLTPRIQAVFQFSAHVMGKIPTGADESKSIFFGKVIMEKGRGGSRALWQWTISSSVGRELVWNRTVVESPYWVRWPNTRWDKVKVKVKEDLRKISLEAETKAPENQVHYMHVGGDWNQRRTKVSITSLAPLFWALNLPQKQSPVEISRKVSGVRERLGFNHSFVVRNYSQTQHPSLSGHPWALWAYSTPRKVEKDSGRPNAQQLAALPHRGGGYKPGVRVSQ
ncbi:hypothetical protein B0H14DRAFT_2619204 [Mycena olivaceomarginata]|nr:hypothetical protein B0H14DRAFT_2619204 [Mycena olivaceomarginata]